MKVEQGKLEFATLTSYLGVSVQVLSTLILLQLPTSGPEKERMMAQALKPRVGNLDGVSKSWLLRSEPALGKISLLFLISLSFKYLIFKEIKNAWEMMLQN